MQVWWNRTGIKRYPLDLVRLVSGVAGLRKVSLDALPKSSVKSLKLAKTIDWDARVLDGYRQGTPATPNFMPSVAKYQSPYFEIRLLRPPESQHTSSTGSPRTTSIGKRIPLQLTVLTTKAGLHNHAVVRNRARTKIQEALKLLITRGIKPSTEKQDLVADEQDVGAEKWLVPDHAYLIIPTLSILPLSMGELILQLRLGLSQLRTTAQKKLTKHTSHTRAKLADNPTFKRSKPTVGLQPPRKLPPTASRGSTPIPKATD